MEAPPEIGYFGPSIIVQDRGQGDKGCMVGGAIVVLLQGKDLVLCGLVCIRVIKDGLESRYEFPLGGESNLTIVINPGLEPRLC